MRMLARKVHATVAVSLLSFSLLACSSEDDDDDDSSSPGDSGTPQDSGAPDASLDASPAAMDGAAMDASAEVREDAMRPSPADAALDAMRGAIDAAATVSATCRACRDQRCRSYMEVDLISGCYEKISEFVATDAGTDDFFELCAKTVECARRNRCGYADGGQASECYCGSADVDECAMSGPSADSPCRPEWEAALRSTDINTIYTRFTDLSFPGAWAYFVVECDREQCASECAP